MGVQNIALYNGTDSFDQALKQAIEASNKLAASSPKKVIIHDVSQEESCAISTIPFKELLEKELLFSTSCKHMFSLPDIISWIGKDPSCPNCRGKLAVEDLAQVVLLKKEAPSNKDSSKNPKDEKVEERSPSPQLQNQAQNVASKPRFMPIIDGKPSDTVTVEQALERLQPKQPLRILDTMTQTVRTMVKSQFVNRQPVKS